MFFYIYDASIHMSLGPVDCNPTFSYCGLALITSEVLRKIYIVQLTMVGTRWPFFPSIQPISTIYIYTSLFTSTGLTKCHVGLALNPGHLIFSEKWEELRIKTHIS